MKFPSTDLQVDTRLEDSAVSPSLFTPLSNSDERALPPFGAPPLANKRYVIKKMGTDEAIALIDGELRIQEVQNCTDMSIRWLCVERGTHFGLYNEGAKTFIGHNGRGNTWLTTNMSCWLCPVR